MDFKTGEVFVSFGTRYRVGRERFYLYLNQPQV